MTTEAAWFLNGVILTLTLTLSLPLLRAAWDEWTVRIRVLATTALITVVVSLWWN